VTNIKKNYQTSPSMSEAQAGQSVDVYDISTCTWNRVREAEGTFHTINVTDIPREKEKKRK